MIAGEEEDATVCDVSLRSTTPGLVWTTPADSAIVAQIAISAPYLTHTTSATASSPACSATSTACRSDWAKKCCQLV